METDEHLHTQTAAEAQSSHLYPHRAYFVSFLFTPSLLFTQFWAAIILNAFSTELVFCNVSRMLYNGF